MNPRSLRDGFIQRGLLVVLVNVLLAVMMQISQPHRSFVQQLVYAQAIGLSTWVMIDFGRFWVKRPPDSGWPTGWRAFALPALAILIGNVFGSWVGDQFSGLSRWSAVLQSPRAILEQLFLIFAVGATISYVFWARGYNAHLNDVVASTRQEAAEAQLRLLQSQLEPHMLFNTLANLQALIATDPTRAQTLLDHLIAYLRSTLAASRTSQHPLSVEFARTADYLALMKVRMADRLQTELDLPDDLACVPVPSLLLQPLVENAIKHGLEPHIQGGQLRVRARRLGGQLRLTVEDNGAGLPEPDAHAPRALEGYGLSHIRQRLSTLYGDAAQLSLSTLQASPNGSGTLAEITLPLKEQA